MLGEQNKTLFSRKAFSISLKKEARKYNSAGVEGLMGLSRADFEKAAFAYPYFCKGCITKQG